VQFKSQSLIEHLAAGWQLGGLLREHFVSPVPAQMRRGNVWYQGTADAIFQNLNLIENYRPDLVAVFGADHIYRMDVRQMVEQHVATRAEVTVASLPVPRADASGLGILEVDAERRVVRFDEKPSVPPEIPGQPGLCLASMGNYLFDAEFLLDSLTRVGGQASHDFGRHFIPDHLDRARTFAYDFTSNRLPGTTVESNRYWRDVGTLDSYYAANMDLIAPLPELDLYNPRWPLRTAPFPNPPAKFADAGGGRSVEVRDSLVSEGCIVNGARVIRSVLGRNVVVHDGAEIVDSVVFENCAIGRGARLQRAILDKNVVVEDGGTLGHDLARDRERYTVTSGGVVVIPKNNRPDV